MKRARVPAYVGDFDAAGGVPPNITAARLDHRIELLLSVYAHALPGVRADGSSGVG